MVTLVKDLVCGMEIDPATAAATSGYKGTTYYFCAAGRDGNGASQRHLAADLLDQGDAARPQAVT